VRRERGTGGGVCTTPLYCSSYERILMKFKSSVMRKVTSGHSNVYRRSVALTRWRQYVPPYSYGSFAHTRNLPQTDGIGSAVLQDSSGECPTHRHSDHGTYDACSNRPHLCIRCGLKYQGCRGYGDPYGDDLPSPQTHGDSMGIFNQPEITR